MFNIFQTNMKASSIAYQSKNRIQRIKKIAKKYQINDRDKKKKF